MGVEGGQGSGQARRTSLLAVVRAGLFWPRQLHKFQPHLAHSRTNETNLSGYAIGYINFAPFLVGTPVINAHKLELAVAGIDNPHPRAKRQIGMGGGETFGVITLSVDPPPFRTARIERVGVAYAAFRKFNPSPQYCSNAG